MIAHVSSKPTHCSYCGAPFYYYDIVGTAVVDGQTVFVTRKFLGQSNIGRRARGRKLYCNRDCRTAAIVQARQDYWAYRATRRENTICQVCGKTFTPARSDAITCSDRCRQVRSRQRRLSQV